MKKKFIYILVFSFLEAFDISASLQTDLNQLQTTLNRLDDQLKSLVAKPIPIKPGEFAYTFDQWATAVDALPYYRNVGENYTNKPAKLTFEEIEKTLGKFVETLKKSNLSNGALWIGNKAPSKDFFDLNKMLFAPYAQKLVVPPGTELSFHGDLHGDIHAVIAYLRELKSKGYIDSSFKIINPNFYIIFLGDYTDRGNYGIEVIYTLLRLKIANPDHVFMVRGNHEDSELNQRYGFSQELQTKFPGKSYASIYRLYDLLPVVLYVGSGTDTQMNFLQCNHGGMEPGYLPKLLLGSKNKMFEWITILTREHNFTDHIDISPNRDDRHKIITSLQALSNDNQKGLNYWKSFNPTGPKDFGFLWNDFFVQAPKTTTIPKDIAKQLEEGIIWFDDGRGWIYGNLLTKEILKASSFDSETRKSSVVGVFRAHQHTSGTSDMMDEILKIGPNRGVAKLWDIDKQGYPLWEGIVCTFNVTPDTAYGQGRNFNFDTYGIVKTGQRFPQDWQFTIYRKEVVPTS